MKYIKIKRGDMDHILIILVEKGKETNNVKEEWKKLPKNEAQRLHYLPPGRDRSKLRSKTFQGIADAMADQWGAL